MVDGIKNQKLRSLKVLSLDRVVNIVTLIESGHGEKQNAIRFLAGYSAFMAKGKTSVATKLLSFAVSEIKHLSMVHNLIERHAFIKPIFSVEGQTQKLDFEKQNLKKTLIEMTCAKCALIADYERVIKTSESQISKELTKILLEEKEHALVLKNFIEQEL